MTSPTSIQGWYPDPTGNGEFRWWTGVQWTYRIASGGQIYMEPASDLSRVGPPQSGPIAGDGQIAPRGTRSAAPPPSGARVIVGPRGDVIEVQLSAGAAFKAGFFAFWGWLTASLMLAMVALVLAVLFGACAAASVRSAIP